MSVLLWWLPPLLATLCAIAWVSWRGHKADAALNPQLSDAELARMARALGRPISSRRGLRANAEPVAESGR